MGDVTQWQLVRAGNLTARIDGPELRDVRAGDQVLASRIYVAVRDHNWDTVPGTVDDYHLESAEDGFRLTFTMRHQQGAVDYRWGGEIVGAPTGEITLAMDGTAESSFRYNKIGFNIHHPLRESVGRHYVAKAPHVEVEGVLPQLIEPQYYENGFPTGMFEAFDDLTVDYGSGVRATFAFEGDLFEMQDHRNWTDGNFKTYGTPCQLGFPMDADQGQSLRQKITMRLDGASAGTDSSDAGTTVTVGPDIIPLPKFGLGAPSHPVETSPLDLELLRRLHLDHLRVDLDLAADGWSAELQRGAWLAAELDAEIELALTIPGAQTDLAELAAQLSGLGVRIARVLVFSAQHKSTPAAIVETVRSALADVRAPFVGGTNAYFAEINRDHPDTDAMDGVVFSITPQVHAFDDASLVESLPAQADVVESTRALADGLPVFVSPVTLRPRFNPNATALDDDSDAGVLPVEVDVRQRLPFGAVWTLGSFANLATAGAAGVTYYETTGWRGVIEASDAAPSELFGSTPGEVFPIFRVLEHLREGSPSAMRSCRVGDPARLQAVALTTSEGVRLLLGNVTPGELEVSIEGLPEVDDPVIALGPYEVARLDINKG